MPRDQRLPGDEIEFIEAMVRPPITAAQVEEAYELS